MAYEQAPTPISELSLDDGGASAARAPRWRELLFDRVVIVPVLIAACLAGGLGVGLATLRQQVLNSEERMLAALSAALADQADNALAAAQTAMQATAEEIVGGAWVPDTVVAGAVLRARAAALPAARQMLLLDAQANVLQAADEELEEPPHARADYFLSALAAAPGSAHIGAPTVWPGQDTPWIPLSMPWSTPHGRHSGVIVVAADTALLLGGFERRSPAPDARLRVLRIDGTPLLESDPSSGWPERAGTLHPPAGVSAWTQIVSRPGDDGRRHDLLLAGHAMQRAPLAVVLSRDTQVVLADWHLQAWLVGGFALAALLVTTVLSLRHAREQRWREHSQRDLQRQRERAARAFAAAREGLWEWDPASERHYLSPRMRELLGFDASAGAPPATHALSWPDRVSQDDRRRLREAIDAHVRERTRDFSVTLRVMPPGQPPRHVRLRGQGLRDAREQLLLLAGTAYDVSDEVAVSEAARRLDEQLQRARQFEALGALAGGVAHDFNNVLAAILGFGERARALVPEGSALAGHVQHMLSAGERGKTLVARMMAFGRTGQGLRQPYRPRALVQEAWTLAVQGVPEGVQARLDLDAEDPELVGDGVAFFEAALNLLRNAVQAVGDRGTLCARLSSETVDQPRVLWQGSLRPGRWLGLRVEDDGPGIDAEHLPRLLEPFYSTRSAQGGTGLGLAVVHAAVRDAHGAIDLRTAPGEGTTITLYLPLPEPATAPTAPGAEEAAWSGQGEVVLVVDDEPALVALLEEHLAERGFEPRGFSDAELAWQAFKAEPGLFAAVLSDQAMPRLGGLELIERCRRLSPGVVTIIATAYGGTDFGARASAAGVQAVLAKPLSWSELDTVLQRLLRAPR